MNMPPIDLQSPDQNAFVQDWISKYFENEDDPERIDAWQVTLEAIQETYGSDKPQYLPFEQRCKIAEDLIDTVLEVFQQEGYKMDTGLPASLRASRRAINNARIQATTSDIPND